MEKDDAWRPLHIENLVSVACWPCVTTGPEIESVSLGFQRSKVLQDTVRNSDGHMGLFCELARSV